MAASRLWGQCQCSLPIILITKTGSWGRYTTPQVIRRPLGSRETCRKQSPKAYTRRHLARYLYAHWPRIKRKRKTSSLKSPVDIRRRRTRLADRRRPSPLLIWQQYFRNLKHLRKAKINHKRRTKRILRRLPLLLQRFTPQSGLNLVLGRSRRYGLQALFLLTTGAT